MENKVSYEYETMGNSSYLVATLNKDVSLINYQMQMLANNDITNILQASKRQKNDDIQIFYNITSKISLAQATARGKMPKQGFVNLIKGIISAYREISEYQLVDSGLVLDSEKIFIKTGTYEPSLIYLPISTEEIGIEPFKTFLLGMIVKNKVEILNDNFLQIILEALNSEALTLDELEKIVNNHNDAEIPSEKIKEKIRQDVNQVERNNHNIKNNVNSRNEEINNKAYERQQSSINKAGVQIPGRTETPSAKVVDIKTKAKDNKQSNNSKGNKNVFLIFQLLFLGIIVGCSFAGILNDEKGNLDFINLLAVVMGCAAIDFILYRSMFKNIDGNENNNVKMQEKKEKKTVKGPNILSFDKNALEEESQNNYKENKQSNIREIKETVEKPVPAPKITSIPEPQTDQVYDDFGTEDTDVLVDNTQNSSYLEYYDNGLLIKIKLDKESVLVGKLKSQVDYAIKNTKISKIHAEFISRNGEYFVKDYNSTNGTYINGSSQRIISNTEQQIHDGDIITLANLELTLRIN